MRNNITNKLLNALKVSTLAIALSLGVSYALAWTVPSTTPPGGNVGAPINASATPQTKAGGLTVGSLNTAGAVTSGSLTTTGAVIAGAVTSGTLNTSGAATVGSLSTLGAVTSGTLTTTGAATVGSLNAGSGLISTLGTLSGDTLIAINIGASSISSQYVTASQQLITPSIRFPDNSVQTTAGAPSHGKRIYTNPGSNGTPANTFIVPLGITKVWLTMSGGGGGGAYGGLLDNNGDAIPGCFGGSGVSNILPKEVAVGAGTVYPVTVGAGGAACGGYYCDGAPGAGSSFFNLSTAAGGAGGQYSGGSNWWSPCPNNTPHYINDGFGAGGLGGVAGGPTAGQPGFVMVEW